MAKMHALHNIWRKNIKDSLLSKPYRRLWSPNFGHSMLYQLRLLFVLFRIKGVVQSVQGSETCIVDTSLLTMMWQNTNTEPVVCVNGCTGENLLSTKLRRRQWSHLNHAAYKSHWRGDNPQQFAAAPRGRGASCRKMEGTEKWRGKKRSVFVMTSHQ